MSPFSGRRASFTSSREAIREGGHFFFGGFGGIHFHGEGGEVFGQLDVVGQGFKGEGEAEVLAAGDLAAFVVEAGHGLQVFFLQNVGHAAFHQGFGGTGNHFPGKALFDDGSGSLALAEAGQRDGSAHFTGGGVQRGVDFLGGDGHADFAGNGGDDFDAVSHIGKTPYE